MNARILVVDDEQTLRRVIVQVLEADGHDVTEAACAEEALERFRRDPFPLVLTDIVMGKMNGLELLKEVKLLVPDALVVVMTSHASLETAVDALRSGAYDYLIKPFEDIDLISAVVNRALGRLKLLDENQRLMHQLRKYTEELEALNKTLASMANRDGLTGLYNHRYFREALDAELARSRRHDRQFSLLFIDIDHFKAYNDTYGHLAGDELLKSFANLLTQEARAGTIVSRYGGEEFVLLVPEADKVGTLRYAERLRELVAAHDFAKDGVGAGGKVTISLGVSTFPGDGETTTLLIDHADQALYRAKQMGRNAACAWSGSKTEDPVEAGEVETTTDG